MMMTVMVEMTMDRKMWPGPPPQTTGASSSKMIRTRKKWPGRHTMAPLPAGISNKAITRGARAACDGTTVFDDPPSSAPSEITYHAFLGFTSNIPRTPLRPVATSYAEPVS